MDEVCGCPLVRNVFDPTGEYCRVSKRKCNKHYCWEKLRRAEVDLERVRVVSQILVWLYILSLKKKKKPDVLLFPWTVVQAGWVVWTRTQCEDSNDQQSRTTGPDASPDHPAWPTDHRPPEQQRQITVWAQFEKHFVYICILFIMYICRCLDSHHIKHVLHVLCAVYSSSVCIAH